MTANAWIVYDSFKEWMGDSTIDLDDDSFICDLVTNGYTPALTHTAKTDLGANIVSGNGYASHSCTVTWTKSGSTTAWDINPDPNYTASGGSITARYAVIWDDTVTTPTADPLVCYSLLDNTPADVSVTDGNTLTVQINASGVFDLSGASS